MPKVRYARKEECELANPEIGLTTSDNPYNPLTEYENWEAFDRQKGYGTNEYLARIVRTTYDYGEATYQDDIERAIDEIVNLNLISFTHEGVSYVKVVNNSEEAKTD